MPKVADTELVGQTLFPKKEVAQYQPNKLISMLDEIREFSTAFYFRSQPGEYIGQGLEQTFTPQNGDFQAIRNSKNGVSICFANFGTNELEKFVWWNLDFAAPEDAILIPGIYESAVRFGFNSPNQSGLDVSTSGRGGTNIMGRFIVLEAEYGYMGEVKSFDAIFEQYADTPLTGPALYGRVRFNELSKNLEFTVQDLEAKLGGEEFCREQKSFHK